MSDPLSYSELLSAFLDGELEGTETTRLFYMLAQDADLQAEMRQHLAIRSALRTPLTSPPVDLKRRISDAAGMVPAEKGNSIDPSVGGWGGIAPILLAVVLSSALTVLVMTAFRGSDRPVSSTQSDSVSSIASPALVLTDRTTSVAPDVVENSFGSGMKDVASKPVSSTSTRLSSSRLVSSGSSPSQRTRGHVDSEQRFGGTPVLSPDDVEVVGKSEKVEIPRAARVEVRRSSVLLPDSGESTEEIASAHSVVPAESQTTTDSGSPILVEVRGYLAASNPQFDLSPLSNSPFRNIAVGGYYELDENHAVGIEVGRESLFQSYTQSSNGITTRYEQNYLASWVTGVYQYSLVDLRPLGVQPFARVGLGAVATGPVGRGMIGARYPIGPVSMMAGAEGTYFLYRYGGEWLSTKKIGITVGASVHF